MNIFKRGWRSEWAKDTANLLQNAEDKELSLSYLSQCGSENGRKKLGSYYTPVDVALFFWAEFFTLNNLEGEDQFKEFWENHHFIEPAVGAGVLVFALLKKAAEMGLTLNQIDGINLTVIDINQTALDFTRTQLADLADRWNINFHGINYICCDFRDFCLPPFSKSPLFFGNPPFITNPKGSDWKNIFADFLSQALRQSGPAGVCHFILPISIAFSRDYGILRKKIRNTGKNIALSSFDNIPDTLFFSGKPRHSNTNKANSQRCSILTIFPSKKFRILSTKMHRWAKNERKYLLSSSARYHDVTEYNLNDQFPRPESATILRYLEEASNAPRFPILLAEKGCHSLFVSSVARNFIGFREYQTFGTHHLQFDNKNKFYSALLILSSDIFLDYWRTLGDGFHVTQKNLFEFPLHHNLMELVDKKIQKGQNMWKERLRFIKKKKHPNGVTISFDFSSSALSILREF